MGIFSKPAKIITDEKKIDELLSRGVSEAIVKENLKKKLMSGRQLRVKLGIDPTSPNLHIGRAVALWKLRQFQDLGHKAVFIIGDATGVVGDTSDKESERPMLSAEKVRENMKTYFDQAFKILDPQKTETHHNSEWLNKLGFLELTRMASLFGLNEFSSRELIAKRLEAGQRVSFHELLYPLMQGYDSVAVHADVELGGTDQRFNLLAGRDIQKLYKQESQDVMMMELLEGTDGRKMSSSWGNVVNLLDTPADMFGKIMSVKDELVNKYFNLCTRVPLEEIPEILKLHPKEAKLRLAFEITSLYNGPKAAQRAKDEWENTFSKGETPADIPETTVSGETTFLEALGVLDESKTTLRRLAEQGAISDEHGKKVGDLSKAVHHSVTLRIGKHRFLKIVVK